MNWKTYVGAAVLVAFVAFFIWTGDIASLKQVTEVAPTPAVLVAAATGMLVLVSSWRWRLVLDGLAPGLGLRQTAFFRVVLLGVTAGQVVPQDVGSAAARLTYLRGVQRLRLDRATYSILLDRWLDVVVLAAAIPASALFVTGLLDLWVAVALLAVLAAALTVVCGLWPSATTLVVSRGFALASAVVRRVLRRQAPAPDESRQGETPVERYPMPLLLWLSFSRLLAVAVRAWLTMLAVGIDLSFAQALMMVPVAQVALMFPLTPGGLGAYEAGWYGLLALQGVPSAESAVFVVVHRVLVVVSLVVMVALTEGYFQVGKVIPSLSGRR